LDLCGSGLAKISVTLRSRNPRIQSWGSVALTTQHLYPQKLALTSRTSGSRSVGIIRSQSKATELFVDNVMSYLVAQNYWAIHEQLLTSQGHRSL
jgi:hypothetical protein